MIKMFLPIDISTHGTLVSNHIDIHQIVHLQGLLDTFLHFDNCSVYMFHPPIIIDNKAIVKMWVAKESCLFTYTTN